jgi:hypothetical protein
MSEHTAERRPAGVNCPVHEGVELYIASEPVTGFEGTPTQPSSVLHCPEGDRWQRDDTGSVVPL